jgi:C-8 sterol isomerase
MPSKSPKTAAPIPIAAPSKASTTESCKTSSCGLRIALVVLVAAVLVGLQQVIGRPENWVFDPVTLKEVAALGVSKAQAAHNGNATSEQIVQSVLREAHARYPNYTVDPDQQQWFFNNAGGAMGSMTVMHASLSEYLIIFGTTLGTEGHTGRYPLAEDFFTIIYGEQWAYPANSRVRETYRVGEQHYLPAGVAKQYKMPDECWALEYARGNIMSMMFFGLVESWTSTMDFVTLGQTVWASGWFTVTNLLNGKI